MVSKPASVLTSLTTSDCTTCHLSCYTEMQCLQNKIFSLTSFPESTKHKRFVLGASCTTINILWCPNYNTAMWLCSLVDNTQLLYFSEMMYRANEQQNRPQTKKCLYLAQLLSNAHRNSMKWSWSSHAVLMA